MAMNGIGDPLGPAVPTVEEKVSVTQEQTPSLKDKLSKIAETLNSFGSNMMNTSYTRAGRSDERLKVAEPDTNMDVLSMFADKIQNYTWTYKPDNKLGLDPTVQHIGPMAQDLLKVPGLASCVVQDESGYLAVDTTQLSLATIGLLSDATKRIEILEEIIYSFIQQIEAQPQDGGIQGV